jgi:hypothetical protein
MKYSTMKSEQVNQIAKNDATKNPNEEIKLLSNEKGGYAPPLCILFCSALF